MSFPRGGGTAGLRCLAVPVRACDDMRDVGGGPPTSALVPASDVRRDCRAPSSPGNVLPSLRSVSALAGMPLVVPLCHSLPSVADASRADLLRSNIIACYQLPKRFRPGLLVLSLRPIG